jgi:hypothetical protein
MVCISVWFRIGLSRYTVEQLGASNPVSHIAHTKTSESGSSGSLNFSSSGGCDSAIRLRCGTMSRPSLRICPEGRLGEATSYRPSGAPFRNWSMCSRPNARSASSRLCP